MRTTVRGLMPSGLEEHEEESGAARTVPTPEAICDDVHYRKTGLLFEAPLSLIEEMGDAYAGQTRCAREALSGLGLACQALDAQAARLREQGLPPQLFKEWQTLARLDERFRDRGEGANLATGLANSTMDYPLPPSERVLYRWLLPDTVTTNARLSPIKPDKLLDIVVTHVRPTGRA